jgi:hypothetical protein
MVLKSFIKLSPGVNVTKPFMALNGKVKSLFAIKMFYRIGPWACTIKKFYSRNLHIFVIS